MKGRTLETGQIVVLALDGTLVYVEAVEPTHAAVVALPDQPPGREDDRVFTPGRVGAKKISPFSVADKVIEIADLSERNKTFIGAFEKLRAEHGVNHVDRTPEEQAAHDAKLAGPPPKAKREKLTDEDKARRKAEKKAAKGPRYLQRCTQCGEQPAHPNHGTTAGLHEFIAPEPPIAPVVNCLACDEPEGADVHTKDKANGGHKFVPGKAARAPKAERAPREPRPERVKREKPGTVPLEQKYRWVENPAALAALVAGNGKFSAGNSGGGMIATIKLTGDKGISVVELVIQHPRPLERLQLAFGQLLGAGLLEAVS